MINNLAVTVSQSTWLEHRVRSPGLSRWSATNCTRAIILGITLLLGVSAHGASPVSRTPTPNNLKLLTVSTNATPGGAAAEFPPRSGMLLLQCGNLIYAGTKSSVCFADRFLTQVADQTTLQVNKKFCPVRLDSDALFDYPFCVMSGDETFTLTEKDRRNLYQYLTQGGFLLVSPGCSDAKWDKSFRQEIKVCFPNYKLNTIPQTHPIFSIVHTIPRLTDKSGKVVSLEGLEINGRLVMVYSKEGLNDVEHAKGCCCCGGNEVKDPLRVNVNVFTYAVVY
jgi:hypothetical protein